MDFDDLLSQVLYLLQRDQRVLYRALRRRFELDDDYLENIKDELIYAKKLAVDEDNRVLVWTGETHATLEPTSQPNPSEPQPVVGQAQPVQDTSSPAETHIPTIHRTAA
jgi:hypothetical protein